MKEITAFPFVASDDTGMIINTGMTMRDYFAAKAMQGMMSDPNLDMICNKVAQLSYNMADAMMKAKTDGL